MFAPVVLTIRISLLASAIDDASLAVSSADAGLKTKSLNEGTGM